MNVSHRLSVSLALVAAHSLALATSTVSMLEGSLSLNYDLPWTSSTTRSTMFAGPYGEASERLWLPELGTLVSSEAQAFVSTKASFGGFCPSGSCSPIVSSLRIVDADTDTLLSNPTVFLSPSKVTVKDYPSAEFNFTPSWKGSIHGVAGSGWEVEPVPLTQRLRLEHTYTVPAGWTNLHAGPSLNVDLVLSVKQSYEPFSTKTYLEHSVAAAHIAGATTDLSSAAGAAGYVRALRGTSGATSSSNLELRDAEYALYGYGAGLNYFFLGPPATLGFLPGSKGDPALDGFTGLPFIQTPLGSAGWYLAKSVAKVNPFLGTVWTAIFNAPPGLTSNLPATTDEMGGLGANSRGFLHGYLGGSVDSLGKCIASLQACGTGSASLFRSFALTAASADAVLSPSMQYELTQGGALSRVGIFRPGAVREAKIALSAGQGHLFVFLGGGAQTLDFGADGFTGSVLVLVDEEVQSFALHSGHFSFLDSVGEAATEFVLLPDDPLGTLPSLKLGFDDSGDVSFMTASITSAVPEPSEGALFAAGCLVVTGFVRLTTKRAA